MEARRGTRPIAPSTRASPIALALIYATYLDVDDAHKEIHVETSKGHVRETTAAPYGAEKRRPTNLTLSPEALEKADRVAAVRGTSVSRLIDDLLSALPDADARPLADELTPAVKRLLGVARDSALTEQDYRQHLLYKYGARE